MPKSIPKILRAENKGMGVSVGVGFEISEIALGTH